MIKVFDQEEGIEMIIKYFEGNIDTLKIK